MAPGDGDVQESNIQVALKELRENSMPRELLEEKLDRIAEAQESSNEHLEQLNGTVADNSEAVGRLLEWRELYCETEAKRKKTVNGELKRLDGKVDWHTGIQGVLTAIALAILAALRGGGKP